MKALGWVIVAAAIGVAAGLGAGGCAADARERIRRARAAVFEKKPEQALKQYRLALDLIERELERREDVAAARVQQARALKGAGDVYYLELRDFRRAAEVYEELIRVCPEAPESLEARVQLADILHVHYGDLRGSISALTAAVERNAPESAELTYRVAKLYFELGDFQQVLLESQRVQQRYETSPFVDDAALLEAQALGAMEGRGDDAQRALAGVVERFPDSQLVPYALYELGKLKAEAGDREGAIEDWVRSLERHPDPAMVQSTIARVRRQIVERTPAQVGRTVLARAPVAAPATASVVPASSVKKVQVAPAKAAAPATTATTAATSATSAEGTTRQTPGGSEAAPAERPAASAPAPVTAPVPVPVHKTSIEAAGGTAEEAASDAADE